MLIYNVNVIVKKFVISIPSNYSMIYHVLYLVLVLSLTYLYKEDLQVYVSNVAVYSLLEIDAFQKISLAKAPINDKIPYLTSGIYTEWGRPFLYFYWYAIMMLSKVPQGYVINITVKVCILIKLAGVILQHIFTRTNP